jgi:hypothetical protein
MLCRELPPQCASGGSPRFPGSDQKEKCENEKTQCHYNNLHFVNKTCWIMMIMAFGILMLGLYDLQVRRVLRCDQNHEDERRCKKKKMQRENMETLGAPELIYFWGLEVLGTTWLTLGAWPFIFLAPLGTQLDFILFLF